MKKNKMMRIASVLLVAVLLSTCAISGTFAKYTSTFKGTATATVAKWAITVSDLKNTDELTTEKFAFNILDTIVDTNGGAEDADVAKGVLAPGTKGSFTILVKNDSQVNVAYTASVSYDQELPITFTVTNPNANIPMGGEVSIVVEWEWPFTDDVENDYSEQVWTVEAEVTVTQAD